MSSNKSTMLTLSEEQEALLALLLAEESVDTTQGNIILPRPNPDEYPLSFAQGRLWFLAQMVPNSPLYNIPLGLRFQGNLEQLALEVALSEIAKRHQTLRATFRAVNGQPMQSIMPTQPVHIPVVDLTGLIGEAQKDALQQQIQRTAAKPFDLSRGPLMRVELVRLAPDEHVLLITLHHIVVDGISCGLLMQELAALYSAHVTGQSPMLPELPIQFADYAHWQREWLQGEALDQLLTFWKEHLLEAPALLELPTDHPRPSVQSYWGLRASLQLTPALTKGLRVLSQQHDVTLFITLLAAFKILLARYTGQHDIVVGIPVANRNRPGLDALIGLFVNTLGLRSTLSPDRTVSHFMTELGKTVSDALDHQDLPFEQLVEVLQPARNLSHSPIFQVLFNYQPVAGETIQLPGVTMEPLEQPSGISKFDLTLTVEESAEMLILSLEYNTDLFVERTIECLLGHYQSLLTAMVANPIQSIMTLPLLTADEAEQILHKWNNMGNNIGQPYAEEMTIHQIFEDQAAQTPKALAVACGNEHLTYQALNERANQLAHHLLVNGVGPDKVIGLCLERSIDLIVAKLAIFKAGGAYLPIDAAYPQERQSYLLNDAGISIVITERCLVDTLPTDDLYVLLLDEMEKEYLAAETQNPEREVKAKNLAYVLYTSGSTGQPKGVAIEHRSVVALLHWAQGVFSADELAGVLASTSNCFDLSIFEIFLPLSCGGTVIMAQNALALPTLPVYPPVTLINTVPSAMRELLRINGVPDSVQVVNLAGEPLQNSLVQMVYATETVQKVYNLYGPSEDTTYSTFVLTEKGAIENPSIGEPIANTQVYILDENRQPTPVNIPGELYLGGAGLARGYLGQPGLTAERWLPNPFGAPGTRLYRTGHLVCWLPDGTIKFQRRLDHQVKIRGFRIELGEIEHALERYPGVTTAITVARPHPSGDKQLVAYLLRQKNMMFDSTQIRNFLQKSLPEHMVPAIFMPLEAFPLTPNGKIDRKALPEPDIPERTNTLVAPITETEALLAEIWATVLYVAEVGIHDNFFDLGGHSLLITQIISRIEDALAVTVPIQAFFENPTIAYLALIVDRETKHQHDDSMVITTVDRNQVDHSHEADLLANLDQLSDEEVEELLQTMEM